MKKKFYDVGSFLYIREQKRGLETAAIIGIGMAAASATTSVVSAVSQKNAIDEANATNIQLQEKALEQQEKLFHEGNRFNMTESEKARVFNSQEAEKNRIFQADMVDNQMQKAMDWFEKYSSPSSQVQQYLDAGLNPATLAGNTQGYQPSFSLPSGSAATGPAASAAGVPSVPQATVQPSALDLGNVMNNVIGSAKSIYDIANTKADTNQKVTQTDIMKASKDLDLDIKRGTIQKIAADINTANADVQFTNKKIEEIGAMITHLDFENKNLSADTANKEMENFYKSQQYEQLLKKMVQDYNISREIADAQLKLYSSEMFKNRQDGLASASMAQFYKAKTSLVPHEAKQIDAYKELLQQQGGIYRTQNYLDTLFGYQERERLQKIGNEQYDKARYENSLLFRLLNAGRSATDSFGNVMLSVYGAKGIIR